MRDPFLERAACRVLIGCLVVVTLCGCSSWRVKPYPAYVQGLEGDIELVRITLNNGDEITIGDAHVEGDSLVGMEKESSTYPAGAPSTRLSDSIERTRVAVALADIGALEVREADTSKTKAAILIPVAAVGLGIILAYLAMMETLANQ